MVGLEKVLNVPWKDVAAIEEVIKQKIPELLALDRAFQNARMHSDRENMRVEGELAIKRAISLLLANHLDLFTQFAQDSEFRERLTSIVLGEIDKNDPACASTAPESLRAENGTGSDKNNLTPVIRHHGDKKDRTP